jgi:hypothetical protein
MLKPPGRLAATGFDLPAARGGPPVRAREVRQCYFGTVNRGDDYKNWTCAAVTAARSHRRGAVLRLPVTGVYIIVSTLHVPMIATRMKRRTNVGIGQMACLPECVPDAIRDNPPRSCNTTYNHLDLSMFSRPGCPALLACTGRHAQLMHRTPTRDWLYGVCDGVKQRLAATFQTSNLSSCQH